MAVFIATSSRQFQQESVEKFSLVSCNSAFRDNITTLIIVNHVFKDLEEFLWDTKQKVIEFLQQRNRKNMKIYSMLTAKFTVHDTEETYYLYTNTQQVSRKTKFDVWYKEKIIQELMQRLTTFEHGPSNATLSEITCLSIHIHTHQPIAVGTYFQTPDFIKNKKAVLNIKNYDNYCFLHSINAHLHPVNTHKDRVANYPSISNFNVTGLTFPMTLKQIPKFEKNNQISINVFGLKKKKLSRITKHQKNKINT